MRIQEARSLVLQALKQPGWKQISNIFISVGVLRAKLEGTDWQRVIDGRQFLQRGDQSLIMEVLWGLIVQGILIPGCDDSNETLPFIRLTEYGKQCLEEDRMLPHDPDGYLKEFRAAIPNADPTIEEYLTEALQCFLRGLNRASAVMLGGASERAILLMIDACGASIGDNKKRGQFEASVNGAFSIFKKYDVFEKQLTAVKPSLPKHLLENLDSLVRGVFDLIRNSRNEAGHPASGVMIDRDLIYSHLRLFIPYCKRVNELTQWFKTNKT